MSTLRILARACLSASLMVTFVPSSSAQGIPAAKAVGPRVQVQRTTAPMLPKVRVERETHPDGSLKKETPYVDGKIHGDVKEYWPGGKQLKSSTRYERGSRQGNAETYFDNGRLETRVPYRNDRMEGLFERWDNPGAKRDAYGRTFQPVVVEQVPYVNGLKEGVRKTWRRINDATTGVLSLEAPYRSDKLHGEVVGHGPGDGKSVRRYRDGLQEGLEEHFAATGKLEVNWKADKKHGRSQFLMDRYGSWPTWEEEWTNGALSWRKEYEYFLLGGLTKTRKVESYNNAHKLHGRSEFWREPDKREKTLEYANGLQHGFADYYDGTGTRVVHREEWRNGAKVADVPAP
jgi:antitoxin component YwqK of YwqJK toxin-antitoxin module